MGMIWGMPSRDGTTFTGHIARPGMALTKHSAYGILVAMQLSRVEAGICLYKWASSWLAAEPSIALVV